MGEDYDVIGMEELKIALDGKKKQHWICHGGGTPNILNYNFFHNVCPSYLPVTTIHL
jgi:hypothetical protein